MSAPTLPGLLNGHRRLRRGEKRCPNCDGPVAEHFTHQNYDSDVFSCKRVNWKRRALAAERRSQELVIAMQKMTTIAFEKWEDRRFQVETIRDIARRAIDPDASAR